ncbi:hypothetical protein QYM36_019741 [Artemia franciscana]|uniref:Reverse transcriptase domain-containing protein n=1 Tax=Artemia franciscana TaxID=6661 RepID=A0AA88KTL2_ARTSF|nr:hypothetical protein QYM36_019741 [Artemia franciscana]
MGSRLKWGSRNNLSIPVSRTWVDEECHLFAEEEARLILSYDGKPLSGPKINTHLKTVFPKRTIDAYKVRRRNADHHLLVAQAIERLSSSPSPQSSLPVRQPPLTRTIEFDTPFDQPSCSAVGDYRPPAQNQQKLSRSKISSVTPLPTPKTDIPAKTKPEPSRHPIHENRRTTRSLARHQCNSPRIESHSAELSTIVEIPEINNDDESQTVEIHTIVEIPARNNGDDPNVQLTLMPHISSSFTHNSPDLHPNLTTLTNNEALDAKLHSLVNICLANKPSEGTTIINEILEEYFYKPTKPKGVSRFEGPMRLDGHQSRKAKRAYRRQQYARIQRLWKKNPSTAADGILDLTKKPGPLTRGVKQGDPLNPFLFNLVVDEALRAIPHGVGFTIKETLIPAIAYADDLVIVSSTKVGLQKSADTIVNVLKRRGLDINSSKSISVGIEACPKSKKTKFSTAPFVSVDSIPVKTLRADQDVSYLGVDIAPYGMKNPSTHNDLNLLLAKIKKAPLTPHQRLLCLKQFIIPRFTHQLTLSPFSAGSLAALDKSVRSSVRAFLDLPHDVPNAYLHARVCDGGLGVRELRLSIPRIRASRIARSIQKVSCFEPPHPFLPVCKTDEMDRHRNYLRELLNVGETYAMSKAHYDKYHFNQLYKSIDGAALKGLGYFPLSQNWVDKPPADLESRRYIRMVHHRINAIPTRSRTARGQGLPRTSRAGCLIPETANHVSMGCIRTHLNRVKRHDRIRDIAAKWLDNEGFRVIREPSFTTLTPGTKRAMGRWRPDILAIKGKDGVIFDAQVRAEGYDLDRLHDEKLDNYRLAPGLIDTIKEIHDLETVKCEAITFARRGQKSPKCYKALGVYFNPVSLGFYPESSYTKM